MHKIQEILHLSYNEYCNHYNPSDVQRKVAFSIMNCKSGKFGCNISVYKDCGHLESHNNSYRNQNCPCCQGLLKELWIDARKPDVIDSPYLHVVFTLPAELNPLIYGNQALLYFLMHKCASEKLLELSVDKKILGTTPGIIQVLHTLGQELNFHPHIHCIITGAGLTETKQLLKAVESFNPVKILGKMLRGKFLNQLQLFYRNQKIHFSNSYLKLKNSYEWNELRKFLYCKSWIPYIKETFNDFGNAIDYLGRYTHRIAISNSRIKSITNTYMTFTAKDYKTGKQKIVTLSHVEFIRRFLMHVLPSGIQKIRYYGF